MIAQPNSIVAVVIRPPSPPTAFERLQDIVERRQVCYEVAPEWSISDGRKTQIGFEMELCGISSNEKCLHPVPGCPNCWRAYDEIREIAEWILPIEERPSRYEIQSFDRALHVAPSKRQRRNEVIVRIVIMHRSGFNRPLDDCENKCLQEMREKLKQLGIHEDYWRDGESNGSATPIIYCERLPA
jgi:hypothetical protein